ncbi:hypothetical protein BAE44_0022522 [Dichanthelium oligosanthes]|uniref:Uncharacterized protein n=1 Tax=Dichanthelium oligosanthes TaxID=888268 RepID=A0A1E5UU73_9POAL|nr:hypothetical protein BAE44_0022522 [Dichanthelium oligosanthes]
MAPAVRATPVVAVLLLLMHCSSNVILAARPLPVAAACGRGWQLGPKGGAGGLTVQVLATLPGGGNKHDYQDRNHPRPVVQPPDETSLPLAPKLAAGYSISLAAAFYCIICFHGLRMLD